MIKFKNILIALSLFTLTPTAFSAGDGTAPIIGPKSFTPTKATASSLYVSPTGKGTSCTLSAPCSISTVIDAANPGSVVFLRDGVYPVTKSFSFYKSGTSSAPIIFESYIHEMAIFDGKDNARGARVAINLPGKFIKLRNLTIRNMPMQGIWITGTDNVLENLVVHSNTLTGIHIYSPYDSFPYGAYGSRNVVKNSNVFKNIDAGYDSSAGLDNGGNADGISVSSGADNEISNNYVFLNSDDGIDAWRSTGTKIFNNLVIGNGLLDGNGNGIKAGGIAPSNGTIVEHNISANNRSAGIDYNSGVNITFKNNTTWGNSVGYILGRDTATENNIAVGDGKSGSGYPTLNNSWQLTGPLYVVSFDTYSRLFLMPRGATPYRFIGARSEY